MAAKIKQNYKVWSEKVRDTDLLVKPKVRRSKTLFMFDMLKMLDISLFMLSSPCLPNRFFWWKMRWVTLSHRSRLTNREKWAQFLNENQYERKMEQSSSISIHSVKFTDVISSTNQLVTSSIGYFQLEWHLRCHTFEFSIQYECTPFARFSPI